MSELLACVQSCNCGLVLGGLVLKPPKELVTRILILPQLKSLMGVIILDFEDVCGFLTFKGVCMHWRVWYINR